MLDAEAPLLGLYFVDDHFVPYEGAKPVGKGYNTKRRHAQKGWPTPWSPTTTAARCASCPGHRRG